MLPSDKITKRVKKDLDDRIIAIELTLIAIIQAVPLFILAEKAVDPIVGMDWQVLPYLGVGLLTVLIFWSRSLIHTLSFIAWPLDFTHNFLYILATLVQAIMVSQISDPREWFALGIAYTVLLWITCAVDLRIIRKQLHAERELNARLLLTDVLEDQLRNVRFYMPGAILFCLAAFALIQTHPESFIGGKRHIVLAIVQLIVSAAYLWEGYFILRRRNERILQARVNDEAE